MENIFELQHTYKEWIDLFCQVQKGQKSIGKNEMGSPVFEIWQTIPMYEYNWISKFMDECEYEDTIYLDSEFYH